MQSATPASLELQNRATIGQGSQRVALWVVAVGTILVFGVAAAVLIVIAAKSGKSINWHDIAARMDSKIQENWHGLLLAALGLVASVLQIFYIALARRRERLVLSELGISYVSTLPAALQFLQPNWSLQWSQVQHAEFKPSAYARLPGLVSLVFHTRSHKRSIRPFLWVDPATYEPPSLKKQFRFSPPITLDTVNEVMESPVIRFIQELPSLKLAPLDLNKTKQFALERNPVAIGSVGVFFVSIMYAIVDALIVNPETYATQPFYMVYVMGGLAIGLIALSLMRAAKVPMTETIVVAILSGGAFGVALYPGLLRINQFTDSEGLQTYQYQMREPAHFIPGRDSLPEIRFPERHREFWSRYAPGYTQEFELRKGGLGFYQINMQPIYDRIDDFYERQSR
jgi:hypothetical protein